MAAAPLASIYLIEFDRENRETRIDGIDPARALPLVSANTFASRVLDRTSREREFHALADLLARVPVRRLTRPCDLAAIPAVRDAILADTV
jgi:hypothetical protein